MSGTIFNIQRYSVNDGPGIRTLVFFKGCPLRCEWCSNPESQLQKQQIMYFGNLCSQCGACGEACPSGCICFKDGQRVYHSPGCEMCGRCEDLCPQSAVKRVGQTVSVDEVVAIAEKDYLFYLNSGGGVTLGGGEPTMQAAFAAHLLEKLKALGIHTALETCGYAHWDAFAQLLPHLDLVLYDLKHMDASIHKRHTGQSNRRILDNLERLLQQQINIVIRIPIIPGFSDDTRMIASMAAYLDRHSTPGRIERIDLLPYHKMGVGKYTALDCDYKLESNETPDDEALEALRNIFSSKGFDTFIEHI